MTVNMGASRIPNIRTSFSFDSARSWLLLIAFIALVGSVYLGQGSQAAIIGQRVQDKQDQLRWTIQEIDQMRSEIASLSDPKRVDSRAKQLGFHQATPAQVKYVALMEYVVEPTPAAAVTVGRTTAASSPSSNGLDFPSMWDALLARLGFAGSRAAEAESP